VGVLLRVFYVTSCAADARALVYRTRNFWRVTHSVDLPSSVRTVSENAFDLLLFDIGLTGCNAEDLLHSLTALSFCPPVFIMSREQSFPLVVLACNTGALDYFHLPCDIAHVINTVNNKLIASGLHPCSASAMEESDRQCAELIGTSSAMRSLRREIFRLRVSDAPVLIRGESGSGKDVAARLLHRNSPASSGPFEALNMGCIPVDLAESLLFGTVRGSFTGSVDSAGAIEQSDGGTLFLDEVAEMGLPVQAKLLRVLEDHMVRKLGSTRSRLVDFRLVCATNRDLEEMTVLKEFRQDLLYRIDVIRIYVPPLREHPEDIPLLAKRVLSSYPKALSSGALERLYAHDWPGNVRQLFSCLTRAVSLASGDIIHPDEIRF
jgi:DNA-binding NtrC family response regulator